MKQLLAISAAVLVTISTLADLIQDGINKHITQMCLVYNGVEVENGRRVLTGVLGGGGSREKVVVVLFSMEFIDGGNFDYQFVSVLKSADTDFGMLRPVFFQKVGGKGIRYVTSMTKTKNAVVLRGLEYGPRDSMASPSVPCAFQLAARDGVISLARLTSTSNSQRGGNGRKPSSPETNRAPAAVSRKSQ